MHARPDGSLPPSPRWMNDDPYRVARLTAGLRCGERIRLDQRRQQLVEWLDELDTIVASWMRERREALDEAEEIHEILWPAVEAGWGRRPPRPGRSPMAPQVVKPHAVRGAALRSLCCALLHRHGELALVELHTLIHVYGYEILSRIPVKTLADSLGYETLEGRAERVRRGVYRARGPAPRAIDPRLAGAPESWFPPSRRGSSASRSQMAVTTGLRVSRTGLEWSIAGRGTVAGSTTAKPSSPPPRTHSGSGPSRGRPVKNLAAMQPPWQAS